MPLKLEGTVYYSAAELQREIGVTRQTLWRWRAAARVPAGRKYRGKRVLFTEAEANEIRAYANRLEPVELEPNDQLKLFHKASSSR